jgi:hypothetical protein
MPSILGANTLSGGYDVANSVRLFSNTFLHKTPTGNSNKQVFTFSTWLKRGNITAEMGIFTAGNDSNRNGFFTVMFTDADELNIQFYDGAFDDLKTNRKFRDVSAWYHIVVAVDTTDGTAANRIKVYVNGVQESSFASSDYPDQNQNFDINEDANDVYVGVRRNSGGSPAGYYDGYIAEAVLIDGSQLAADQFGEFDEDSGIWKPINVSGLTFGTNGFYLDFEDSSNLGNDVNGGTDLTENNLAATDQTTDTCTNNFATMNSLDNYYASTTFSEGNLKMVTNGGAIVYNTSTIGFSSGKWYMEVKLGSSSGEVLGVITGPATANNNDNKIGNRADGWGYDYRGLVENAGSDEGGTFAAFDSGDVIGVYADLDNDKIYFSKNGTLQNSGTGLNLDVSGSPTYFFAVGDNHGSNSGTFEVNFGNPVSALSSAVSDGTYGSFEYSTTITGDGASKTFKALNTKNLAEFG